MEIASVLREARRRAGLSQRALAEAAGTSQPAVARYESGAAVPSLPTLQRLLEQLDVAIEFVPRRTSEALPGPVGRRAQERREVLNEVLERNGARRPRIFGSAARGADTPDSDLDLLVELERPTLVKLARLERELSAAFGGPVDVAVPETLRPEVREEADREGVLL